MLLSLLEYNESSGIARINSNLDACIHPEGNLTKRSYGMRMEGQQKATESSLESLSLLTHMRKSVVSFS